MSAILPSVASAMADRFERIVRDHAHAIAVRTIPGGAVSTFADLAADRDAIRAALTALGLERGDVVVALVGNRPIFFSIVVACMAHGVALVPVGQATDAEVAALVEQAGAVALVADRPAPIPATRA